MRVFVRGKGDEKKQAYLSFLPCLLNPISNLLVNYYTFTTTTIPTHTGRTGSPRSRHRSAWSRRGQDIDQFYVPPPFQY